MSKHNIKLHLESAGYTFITGFMADLLINIDKINLDNLEQSVIMGVIAMALRAGIKAVLQLVLKRPTV